VVKTGMNTGWDVTVSVTLIIFFYSCEISFCLFLLSFLSFSLSLLVKDTLGGNIY